MTTSQLTIVWIVTGIVVAGFVVWLLTRWIRSGTNPGLPKSGQYDTQDAPPADSDTPGGHSFS